MKIRFLLLTGFLFVLLSSYAQTNYINCVYNDHQIGDLASTVIPVDNAYYVVGNYIDSNLFVQGLFIMKIDSVGNIVYRKNYARPFTNYYSGSGGSFFLHSKNGFAICMSQEDTLGSSSILQRFNAAGDTLWAKTYKDTISITNPFLAFANGIEIPNTGYVMTGQIEAPGQYNSDIVLIKTDTMGNEQWRKIYGTSNVDYARSIIATPDKGYLLGGYRYTPGIVTSGDGLVIKTDSLGNKEWERTYGGPLRDGVAYVALAHDSNYIVGTIYATYQGLTVSDGFINIIKVDVSGNEIWNKQFNEVRVNNNVTNIMVRNDGDIVSCGFSFYGDSVLQYGGYLGWILRTNMDGDSIWYRDYEHFTITDNVNDGSNYLNDIKPTSDGGFVACGESFCYTVPQSIWVLKVDSFGCDTPGCQYAAIKKLEKNDNKLLIYPNPCNDYLTLLYSLPPGSKKVVFTLYNSVGVKVKEMVLPPNTQQFKVNTNTLTSGIYFVALLVDSDVVGKAKVVVVRD